MYQLLLKNARVVDPAQNLDSISDVAFRDGSVCEIGPNLAGEATQTRDLSGLLVVPGLIDLHTHVYWGGTSIGVDPDSVAAASGCTTMVDAGTAGPGNIRGMRAHIIEPADTRVLVYLNASFAGIYAFSHDVMVGECTDIRMLHPISCRREALAHSDIVVGIKVRVGLSASGSNGIAPLDIALEVAEDLGIPVMAHLDNPPPSRREVLERLRPGDVLTHCFRPFPNAPVRANGEIFEEIIAARERGVIFDIGHGAGSFGYSTARAMVANGFFPDVISSDVHTLSIDGPAHDLLITLSKFLCLGMPLNEVIRAATEAPAKAIRHESLGSLAAGTVGDASILELAQGEFTYVDSTGERVLGDRKLLPRGRVMGGVWYD